MMTKRVSLFGITVLVMLNVVTLSYATDNTIPYGESFEAWPSGGAILSPLKTNGWYGDPLSVAYITNINYAAAWSNSWYLGGTNIMFPLSSAAHAKNAFFTNAAMSNVFANIADTATIVDFMMCPVRSPDAPDPSIIGSAQTVLYVDNAGTLKAWYYSPVSATSGWVSLQKTFDASNTNWARATLTFDYTTAPSNFFKVTIDGIDQVPASGSGYINNGTSFVEDPAGVWMVAANQSSPRRVGAVGMSGNGGLDDLVVTTDAGVTFYSFTLTGSAGPNGTVSPLSTNVPAGASVDFTITALTNHCIATITTNGWAIGTYGNNDDTNVVWTWTNVQGPGTLAATFTYRTFLMTVSPGAGGTISPVTFLANAGSNVLFTIKSDPNYRIVSITTNGGEVGYSYNNDSTTNTFTWTNIQAAGEIAAAFDHRVFNLYGAPIGTNGTVTPMTNLNVWAGSTNEFTITAEKGFRIVDIKKNGTSIGWSFNDASKSTNYSWADVQADGWLTASFTNQIVRGSVFKTF